MTYDILIVGSGMVGATIACALAQKTSFSIAVLEANPLVEPFELTRYHHRVSAISLASQRIFSAIKVWDDIAKKRVNAFTKMEVWDASSKGKIQFDCRDLAVPQLGFIIENNVIQSALFEKMRCYPQVKFLAPVRLNSFHPHEDFVEIETENQGKIRAKLAIAADGARSWLREKIGISLAKMSYEQTAIVATVTTKLAHENTARQVFLPTGPLAFLPLNEAHTSSIVWSLPTTEANNFMAMDDETFRKKLAEAFSHRLGDIMQLDKRHAFPLQKQQAANYISSRVALVGDAAHTMHPLAGQGVNLGLLDAASLVDVIVDSVENHRDFSAIHQLRRYERWRRADNSTLLNGVDYIKKLFESDQRVMQTLRSFGLQVTDQFQIIKNIFIRHAIGDRGDLPKLAAGYVIPA